MAKKSNRGGAREGAGAKPKTDKKVYVRFWILESVLKSFGGKDKFIEVSDKSLTRLINKHYKLKSVNR